MDLMARYENRSRASVEHVFVHIRRLVRMSIYLLYLAHEYLQEFTDTALFSYKAYEIDVETVDLELVLSHLFRVSETIPARLATQGLPPDA